jgi:hypothetical protein
MSGGLLFYPWIVSLFVMVWYLTHEIFLEVIFFVVYLTTFLPTYWSVDTVLFAARVRAFGFALLTHTSTHAILAVKAF